MTAIKWNDVQGPNQRAAAALLLGAGRGMTNSMNGLSNTVNQFADRQRLEEAQQAQDAENALKAGILGYSNQDAMTRDKASLINQNGSPDLALTETFNKRFNDLTPAEKEYQFKKMTVGDNQEQSVTFDPTTGGVNLLGSPNDIRKATNIDIRNQLGGGPATPDQWSDERKIAANIPVSDTVYTDQKTGLPNVIKRSTSSQAQTDSASYGSRMEQSHKDFAHLKKQGFDPTSILTNSVDNAFIRYGGDIGNYLSDEDSQAYNQIQNNWGSANLRDESGAVLTKHELANEITKYYPQPGDKPTVVKNKARLRGIVEKGMRAKAGGIPSPITADPMDGVPVGNEPEQFRGMSDDDVTRQYRAFKQQQGAR